MRNYANHIIKFLIPASLVLQYLRTRHSSRPVKIEQQPPENPDHPSGPYRQAKPDCSLMLYVPRNLISRFIDDITGGYGYSHAAVDVGEVDQPSGKALMIEAMPGSPVRRSFQDRYGKRHFARVSLRKLGVDCQAFSACVRSMLGEPYDNEEALTWGKVDDPARQVCTDLVTNCLPDEMREDIADKAENGQLHPRSVSVNRVLGKIKDLFVSPNGYAQYLNLLRGEKLDRPDEELIPFPPIREAKHQPGSKRSLLFPGAAFLAAAAGLLFWFYHTLRVDVNSG